MILIKRELFFLRLFMFKVIITSMQYKLAQFFNKYLNGLTFVPDVRNEGKKIDSETIRII